MHKMDKPASCQGCKNQYMPEDYCFGCHDNQQYEAKPNYAVAPTSMYEGFLDEKLVKNKDLSFFNYPFEELFSNYDWMWSLAV